MRDAVKCKITRSGLSGWGRGCAHRCPPPPPRACSPVPCGVRQDGAAAAAEQLAEVLARLHGDWQQLACQVEVLLALLLLLGRCPHGLPVEAVVALRACHPGSEVCESQGRLATAMGSKMLPCGILLLLHPAQPPGRAAAPEAVRCRPGAAI